MTVADLPPSDPNGMKDRSPFAASCLEIAGYVQFPLGVLASLALLAGNDWWSVATAVLVPVLSFVSAGLALLSGKWLRKGQTKGWIAGVILSGVYLASLLLPLAALTLWALLSKGTRHRYLSGKEET